MPARPLGAAPRLPRLYARVVADALPLGRSNGASRIDADSNDEDLAGLAVRLPAVTTDLGRLAAYRRVCGFTDLDARSLPATYPHVLAFGLHLTVLSDSRFPFPALGVVHIANRIDQRAPIGLGESVGLTVSAEDLRPHPRGRQVTLVTEAGVAGHVVWRGETVLLHRQAGVEQPPLASAAVDVAPQAGLPGAAPSGPATWRLPADLGRRYARVSGDVNPIHLYDVTARAFGFPRHIAHGMWTTAACLAALSNRLDGAFTVDVGFRRPISLPSIVRFGARDDGDTLDFGVASDEGIPSVVGASSARWASRDAGGPSVSPSSHLVGRITRR